MHLLVRELVHDDDTIDIKDNDGNTALHYVCRRGGKVQEKAYAVVRALFSHKRFKPNPNAKNKRGNTPLHLLCHTRAIKEMQSRVDVARFLVEQYKARVSIENNVCIYVCTRSLINSVNECDTYTEYDINPKRIYIRTYVVRVRV